MSVTAVINGAVITVDDERTVLDSGTVLIEDEHITAVGPADSVPVPADAETIDASGMVVLPGLINCHTHVPQILLRGSVASQDRGLYDWLINVLYPGLDAYELSDIRTATMLYCVEAIRSGMTCLVDNEDAFPDQTLEAAAETIGAYSEAGIRAIYARMMFDQSLESMADVVAAIKAQEPDVVHADFTRPTGALLSDLEHLIRAYNGSADGRIQVWPGPAHTATASGQIIEVSQRLAREHGTMWTMHLADPDIPRSPGVQSSTEVLQDKGLLDERLLAGHCINLDPIDVKLLKAADVKVSTQAVSSSYLAMGMTPLMELLDEGVTVAMGTDDVNCNESVNILSDMKTLALVSRAMAEHPSALTPEKVIEMATIEGARAVGMEDSIGSIEPGKLADLILVDLRHPQTTPTHHLPTTIVFATYGNEVDTVIINGRVVMRGRQLSFMTAEQELALYADAAERARAISRRAGLRTTRAWSEAPDIHSTRGGK